MYRTALEEVSLRRVRELKRRQAMQKDKATIAWLRSQLETAQLEVDEWRSWWRQPWCQHHHWTRAEQSDSVGLASADLWHTATNDEDKTENVKEKGEGRGNSKSNGNT